MFKAQHSENKHSLEAIYMLNYIFTISYILKRIIIYSSCMVIQLTHLQ